jgi:hypothetical protein
MRGDAVREYLPDVALIVGVVCLLVLAYLVWPPLMLGVGGLTMLAVGVFGVRTERRQ